VRSWILELEPIRMTLTSARTTQPYQIDDLSHTCTLPANVAHGATQAVEWTLGSDALIRSNCLCFESVVANHQSASSNTSEHHRTTYTNPNNPAPCDSSCTWQSARVRSNHVEEHRGLHGIHHRHPEREQPTDGASFTSSSNK
jgi:hypothetical protein